MTADDVVLFNFAVAAVCASLFAVLYPSLSRGWRRTWIGWALLTSSTSLAATLGLVVAAHLFGTDYLHSGVVRIAVSGGVAAGAALKLTALLRMKVRAMRSDRDS